MRYSVKNILKNAVAALEVGYRVVRGSDYRSLSKYILQINQHKDIDAILFEVSKCLKDILDYELFGFALQNGGSMDVWVDPRLYRTLFTDYVARDFECQNIDYEVHYFDKKTPENSQNSDAKVINNLISYKVIDNNYQARLYIQPQRKMFDYHDNIISTIIRSITIALENNLSIKQLENAAAIDPLTNCYNRRALSTFIENDIAYAHRNGNELSVIILDMDNFKEINDRYGHLAGDAVLKEISRSIPLLVRKSDYLARYGGEEFVLVLPDSALYSAVQLAEKIRKTIMEHAIVFGDKSIAVTASFGVASLENKLDASSLLQEADERLYKAKSTGKNIVVPSLLPCFADRNFVAKKRAHKYTKTARVG